MALSVHSQNGGCEVEETDVFRQFDVVSDHSDHYYFLNSKSKTKSAQPADYFADASSRVHKKIMQEWRILEKSLPKSIIVRVYERRLDLLRAAIVGVAGTPYHDGLFFFDVAFPPDYPTRPPHIHYRSFGFWINPNLFPSGRVCLSLMNTWIGNKSEKWNPGESTVLQILVSIQALVLNEKPYSNETIRIFPAKEKYSVSYNEDVFVMSCKTMLYLMRNPPKNFEGFVAGHFRERGRSILLACKSYANGSVRVGYFRNDGFGTSTVDFPSGSFDVSKKFKGRLKKLYPELVVAFLRAGASLGNSIEQLNWEDEKKKRKKKPKQVTEMRARKIGGVARLFGKLKKFFRLKRGGTGSSNVKK